VTEHVVFPMHWVTMRTQSGPIVRPNVRAKREPTAGHQARAGENGQRTTGPGLVACRWRSA
jgi:hypothetical protein